MKNTDNGKEIFEKQVIEQMKDVFEKMEKGLLLKLFLNSTELSRELREYISAITELTDKLTLDVTEENSKSDTAPYAEICYEDGASTGLAFHGVPAGHELTSFILGLYNTAGPGQALEEGIKSRIASINTPLDIKVLVTLSCHMCPDLVVAAQHIAAKNALVTAHIYDISHFPEMRNKYNVMSVPCLVVNEDRISFGRKNIKELLDFIENE